MLRGTSCWTTSSRRHGVRRKLTDHIGERDVGDTLERGRQLLEWVTPRYHLGYQPGFRTGDRAAVESRHEAGFHGGRFADPRRPDDDEQPLPLDDREHLGDGAIPTVEVLGVGLLERLEATVRVAGGHEIGGRSGRDGERGAQLCDQLVDRTRPTIRIGIRCPAQDAGNRPLTERQRPVQRRR